jgi:hypothetical protein
MLRKLRVQLVALEPHESDEILRGPAAECGPMAIEEFEAAYQDAWGACSYEQIPEQSGVKLAISHTLD